MELSGLAQSEGPNLKENLLEEASLTCPIIWAMRPEM